MISRVKCFVTGTALFLGALSAFANSTAFNGYVQINGNTGIDLSNLDGGNYRVTVTGAGQLNFRYVIGGPGRLSQLLCSRLEYKEEGGPMNVDLRSLSTVYISISCLGFELASLNHDDSQSLLHHRSIPVAKPRFVLGFRPWFTNRIISYPKKILSVPQRVFVPEV